MSFPAVDRPLFSIHLILYRFSPEESYYFTFYFSLVLAKVLAAQVAGDTHSFLGHIPFFIFLFFLLLHTGISDQTYQTSSR